MDYTYIHPMFTEDDRDSAIDFLADRMIDTTNIAIYGGENQDGEPNLIPAQHLSKEFVREMTRGMVDKMYGVNVITMANFAQVQDIFYDKYASYLIKYLNLCGIKAELAMFCPSSISPYALAKYVQQNQNKPLAHYNPNKHWTFKVSDDIGVNLMNPLNGMDIVILRLRGIKEYMYSLIKAMYMREPTPDELEYNDLDLKILPMASMSELLDLVRILNIVFQRKAQSRYGVYIEQIQNFS